jgi:hypothetical protein
MYSFTPSTNKATNEISVRKTKKKKGVMDEDALNFNWYFLLALQEETKFVKR